MDPRFNDPVWGWLYEKEYWAGYGCGREAARAGEPKHKAWHTGTCGAGFYDRYDYESRKIKIDPVKPSYLDILKKREDDEDKRLF